MHRGYRNQEASNDNALALKVGAQANPAATAAATKNQPIPVTILTGLLGSGKTTLLNRILGELHAKKTDGTLEFDGVVIETTGLADPAPVAQTFFVDDDIGQP